MPIALRHQLIEHPAAPVIRTVMRIYDQPNRPLAIETFINIEQEDQREDFARLGKQDQLILLFYDEELRHQLTKVVPHVPNAEAGNILNWADRIRRSIPEDRYDFDRAKADVVARMKL